MNRCDIPRRGARNERFRVQRRAPAGPRPVFVLRPARVAALALLLPLCGCMTPRRDAAGQFEFAFDAPRNEFRPGEALTGTAILRNHTNAGRNLPALNARSVHFLQQQPDDPAGVRILPVYSPYEQLDETAEIAARAALERTFVFTALTDKPGTYTLQIYYEWFDTGESQGQAERLFAAPLRYRVLGDALFRRDPAGLIVRADALRIARDYVRSPLVLEDARLIRNEAGFLDWYVQYRPAPADRAASVAAAAAPPAAAAAAGTTESLALLINPYLGLVRKEARAIPKLQDPAVVPSPALESLERR